LLEQKLPQNIARRRKRHDLRTVLLYIRAVLWEFRWTLVVLVSAELLGGVLFMVTPVGEGGQTLGPLKSFFAAWMALFGQPIVMPETWYLIVLCAIYPLLGFFLIGEGIVRLAFLITSRRHGEKEWMMVKASTYREHVVLCGLGHLGYRVLEQLVASHVPVVALEKDDAGRFMAQAKATGVPILVRDMKDDQALLDAGVAYARAIIIATNDDMANLEVALDARRMNPKIRIIMRLFDQQIAAKVSNALAIDEAFSASALAAPVVAAMALETPILASFPIAGVMHATAEITVAEGSSLAGRSIKQVEAEHGLRVLALEPRTSPAVSHPPPETMLTAGDRLVVNTLATQIAAVTEIGRAHV
jgi:voltage-gated potassium channel